MKAANRLGRERGTTGERRLHVLARIEKDRIGVERGRVLSRLEIRHQSRARLPRGVKGGGNVGARVDVDQLTPSRKASFANRLRLRQVCHGMRVAAAKGMKTPPRACNSLASGPGGPATSARAPASARLAASSTQAEAPESSAGTS